MHLPTLYGVHRIWSFIVLVLPSFTEFYRVSPWREKTNERKSLRHASGMVTKQPSSQNSVKHSLEASGLIMVCWLTPLIVETNTFGCSWHYYLLASNLNQSKTNGKVTESLWFAQNAVAEPVTGDIADAERSHVVTDAADAGRRSVGRRTVRDAEAALWHPVRRSRVALHGARSYRRRRHHLHVVARDAHQVRTFILFRCFFFIFFNHFLIYL